jgi:DNA-binding CsgD family transcriptional regulator
VDDTDQIIAALYAEAVDEDWETFRARALTRLREWLNAPSVAWYTRSAAAEGEFTESPQGLGVTPQMLKAVAFDEAAEQPIVANLGGNGKRPGVVLSYTHQDGALKSSVALWFGQAKRNRDSATMRRVIGHMVEAGALSLRQFIGRDEWLHHLGRSNRGSTALVDSAGTFYASSPRFRALLAEQHHNDSLAALPFKLPDAAFEDKGQFSIGDLHFRAVQAGSLVLLNARRLLPLDSLSPREQEIARALAEGKTFKSIARQYTIAISTVANHASRIYKKIGVFRREDLVLLMRKRSSSKIAANLNVRNS